MTHTEIHTAMTEIFKLLTRLKSSSHSKMNNFASRVHLWLPSRDSFISILGCNFDSKIQIKKGVICYAFGIRVCSHQVMIKSLLGEWKLHSGASAPVFARCGLWWHTSQTNFPQTRCGHPLLCGCLGKDCHSGLPALSRVSTKLSVQLFKHG